MLDMELQPRTKNKVAVGQKLFPSDVTMSKVLTQCTTCRSRSTSIPCTLYFCDSDLCWTLFLLNL